MKLTLKHPDRALTDVIGHNFVWLAAGTGFNKSALSAKKNEDITESMEKDIVLYTQTTEGVKTAEVTFTVPAQGAEDFFCSFRGHSAIILL